VPRTRIPDALRAVDEVCAPLGVRAISYGHAGDGNLHVNLLRGELEENEWRARRDRACREVIARIVALGGTISGEHGIGLVARDLVPLQLGAAELRLLRGIKRAFDPNGILNPGKLIPDE
jgi:glycolate oxidase